MTNRGQCSSLQSQNCCHAQILPNINHWSKTKSNPYISDNKRVWFSGLVWERKSLVNKQCLWSRPQMAEIQNLRLLQMTSLKHLCWNVLTIYFLFWFGFGSLSHLCLILLSTWLNVYLCKLWVTITSYPVKLMSRSDFISKNKNK